MEKLQEFIDEGLTNTEIIKILNISLDTLRVYRSKLNYPTSRYIKLLNNNPDFKDYFKQLYINNTNDEIVNILKNHSLFIRKKLSASRIIEIRNFYKLEHKMYERVYESEYDRIRGYIIRNSKFMARRRGIHFDLKYTDFEIPEYCPILNIKLTYLNESNGNHFSHSSLDRIDNSKGYIKGNVIVISRLANAMKNEANFEQLELFSENILKLINFYKNQGALGSITDVFDNFSPKLSLDS